MRSQASQIRIIHPCNNSQVQSQVKQASFLSLFRFTKPFDILLMIFGSIAACMMGASLPLFCLFYGDMVNSFSNLDSMVDQAKRMLLHFVYLGVGALGTGWIMMLCWTVAGERQSNQCRKQYLKNLVNQQIAWFDTHNQSEMATQFSVNTHIFRSVLGQKISILLMILSMFITGVTIAFVKGWLMTLVVMVSIPFVIFGWYLFSKATIVKNNQLQKLYEKGGSKVQQSLSCIKTIKQLNGEQHQITSYSNLLEEAVERTFKYGIFAGVGSGLAFTFLLLSFALAMWYGSQCVKGTQLCPSRLHNGNMNYTPGDILVIFYGLLFPAVNLSQLTPAVQKILEGKQAASKIFHIIDRKPKITSPLNPNYIDTCKGNFKFQKVTFAYPKDKSKNILDRMTFQINGRSSAFIGESGCGKSTIFQLMMRFYDPDQGVITLDGIDLRQLDLNWLRSQIGYVGQEPVLFATSIRQNLLLGKCNATQIQLEHALRKAEAFNFVNNFKDKLDTYVGSDGNQLSGGQKQRIAIARALLKDPKILLLDEATSALDRHNQKRIQSTLNQISQNRMSITITHHLKTIEKCQNIWEVQKGRIIEHGQYPELLVYKNRMIEFKANEIKKDFDNEDEYSNKIQLIEAVLQKQQSKSMQKYQKPIQSMDIQKDQSIYLRLFCFIDNKIIFGVGIMLAIANGIIFPLFGIFLSKVIVTLIQYSGNTLLSLGDNNTYLLIMLLVALLSFPICLFQQIIFTKIGEEITFRIRKETFQKIIKMPIPWFQKKENSDGHIAASLQKDCRLVNGIFTTYMAHLIINISTLVFGIILALVYEWRTALVALGLLPLIILSQAVQMAYSNGLVEDTDKSLKQSAGYIKETIDNIRTVKSFVNQQLILQRYSQKLETSLQKSVHKGHITGLLFGFSYFVMFVIFAFIFYLGAIFIRDNNVQLSDMFTAMYLIIFAGIGAGNNASQMPDLAQARHAASNIFQILDGEDEDQLQIKNGSLKLKTPIKGNIKLINVEFKYENRQELVLSNINLEIKEGDKIGFVGQSGSGKSTIIQLLLGFYTPTSGKILIDDINLRDYDIHHLRANFGVVSQEPILFNQTIEYNIKYNKENATQDDIVSAANQANFNPDKDDLQEIQIDKIRDNKRGMGFSQSVGLKGSHISGGQKQRVAIARVILRHPSILLLDEATSALDEINQAKVQDSLDRLMSHKTCITVTHRMQTVKNTDQIVVFENGKVVETGMFDELSEIDGYFTQFLRTSSTSSTKK